MHTSSPPCSSSHPDNEAGQATITMVIVIALAAGAAVLLSILGQAIVHRAQARNAADAVALAGAINDSAANELGQWYTQRDVPIERTGTQTTARSGPSRAAAWASTEPSRSQPAPALAAIVARAAQLLDTTFTPVQWQPLAITVSHSDAAVMRTVAAELGLCEAPLRTTESGNVAFELC